MCTSNNIISQRRYDLDNLRTFLTSVVAVHHTSIVYGGVGGTALRSALIPPGAARGLLGIFNAFNQSFFMAVFFWISGRVSSQSLAKGRSRSEFVSNKARRLLLPAVAHTVMVTPLVAILCMEEKTLHTIAQYLSRYFTTLRGVTGPVWYTATLFSFDAVAAVLAPANSPRPKNVSISNTEPETQVYGRWGWLAVAGACFLTRLYYPCNSSTLKPFNVQPGYLPQYIYAYILGYVSYHQDNQLHPETPLNEKQTGRVYSRIGLVEATTLSLASFSICALPYALSGDSSWVEQMLQEMSGGWNIAAASYALWNEFSCSLVAPALVDTFYRKYNQASASSIFQPRYSYAAFLVHWLIIAATATGVDGVFHATEEGPYWKTRLLWKIAGPILMTCVLGTINTLSSFILGKYALKWIPRLGYIL